MKTLDELLKSEPVYLHCFVERNSVISEFEGTYGREPKENEIANYEGVNILFASYGQDNYSGEAFVLYEKEGRLFEVNASHCSCYGLENQWEPMETDTKSLKFLLENGRLGHDDYSGNEFAEELKAFLGI